MVDAVCPPAPFLYSISRFFVSGAGYSGTTMRWSTALTPKPAASNCLLAGSLNGKCTRVLLAVDTLQNEILRGRRHDLGAYYSNVTPPASGNWCAKVNVPFCAPPVGRQ